MLLGRPIAPTGLLIDEGVRRLKAAGSDVVLIDPQYAPKVIAQHDEHDVDLMVALISTASRDMHINLFQRFALMRYWRLTKGFPFSAFLSKDDRRARTVFPPHARPCAGHPCLVQWSQDVMVGTPGHDSSNLISSIAS